ncbi:predicted protein [Nematostella vectensis]|uniref:Amidohydrolase 3 domain-containing protein n=1 Tax=Nematostella vectensis TaxID=45351 RepID=A7RMQ3_NEMVE|nr:predicted protein [Nematostella vectensis]|eukprot:XP_001639370.1 predicted protein [Nematostella vectensis]
MNDESPKADALAVTGETIAAIGDEDHVFQHAGKNTKFIHLNNQTVMPGLIEPHQHAITVALFSKITDISGYYYHSYAEVKARILSEIASVDVTSSDSPSPCVFRGWDPEIIRDLPGLNANVIEREFSAAVPVAILGQNLHAGWVNNKAFEVLGIDESVQDTPNAVFGRGKDGKLTGELYEPGAIFLFLRTKMYNPSKLVQDTWRDYAAAGFTTITDILNMSEADLFQAAKEYARNDSCPLRLAIYHSSGLVEKNGPSTDLCGTFWIAGRKFIADGSPHCGTSATREPYLDNEITRKLSFPPSPNNGILLYETKDLYDKVRLFHDEGRQVAIHAHGERAIDQALEVYEKIQSESDTPPSKLRHRIEHLGFVTQAQLVRAGKLGLALSLFVDHLYFYAKSFAQNILGPERTNRWAPLSLATKHGLNWTIHQDHPAFPGPPRPFGNMRTAVTRTQRDDGKTVHGPEYRVTIDEALKAYTINAAWQLHRESDLGSLEPSKKADLVILSADPRDTPPLDLESLRVIDTYIGGRSNGLSKRKNATIGGRFVQVYGD